MADGINHHDRPSKLVQSDIFETCRKTSSSKTRGLAIAKGQCNDRTGEESHVVAKGVANVIHILRLAVLFILVSAAVLLSFGVYKYTKKEAESRFEAEYRIYANELIEAFHMSIERRLGAINAMATAITSHALATNQTFPFVTVPDFGK